MYVFGRLCSAKTDISAMYGMDTAKMDKQKYQPYGDFRNIESAAKPKFWQYGFRMLKISVCVVNYFVEFFHVRCN